MKKMLLFIFLLFIISFSNCDFLRNNKTYTDFQIQNTGKVNFNEQIKSFLTDFISEIQIDSCIYELYVDKKDRDEYQLSLLCKQSNNEYFRKNYPVNYTKINGKTVFIYSGIEDFIYRDTCCLDFENINRGSQEYICACYKIVLKDTSYIVKSNIDLISPFCIGTLKGIVEFEPPELNEE